MTADSSKTPLEEKLRDLEKELNDLHKIRNVSPNDRVHHLLDENKVLKQKLNESAWR
jgi:hypothetical protein